MYKYCLFVFKKFMKFMKNFKIDSTWMVYNMPRTSSNDTPTEHAGFLMALGLNGHLSRLSTLSIHDYLCKVS